MPTSFRGEVFKMCKYLQKDETAQRIGQIIHDMSAVSSTGVGEKVTNSHNDFAYIAKHSNTEFHGFLFLDDNIENIELPQFFNPEHLSCEERVLIEQGHKTLTRFVDLCLSEIACKSNCVAEAMNPYFLYKEVDVQQATQPLISDEDLQPAVTAFKNGEAYKALMVSNFTTLFNKIDITAMQALVGTIEKDIYKSLGENVAEDLNSFSLKLASELNSVTDVMFAFSILMFALKESLKLSCRLLYRAICGVDLFVLDNDNIIKIERKTSTMVCEFYKVFAQDIFFDNTGSEMGSILLIDCDIPDCTHIHEFGMVLSKSLNFAGEFGETAKYSFVTVDEEMINIHQLVKSILKSGLPVVNEVL